MNIQRALAAFHANPLSGILLVLVPVSFLAGRAHVSWGARRATNRLPPRPDPGLRCAGPDGGGAFVLAINVELKAGRMEEWLTHWGRLADHVRKHEPRTLAYEAMRVEGQPDKLFVFERYCGKDALTEVHQKSAPFLAFKQWCQETEPYVSKEGFGAYETRVGYMLPVAHSDVWP